MSCESVGSEECAVTNSTTNEFFGVYRPIESESRHKGSEEFERFVHFVLLKMWRNSPIDSYKPCTPSSLVFTSETTCPELKRVTEWLKVKAFRLGA